MSNSSGTRSTDADRVPTSGASDSAPEGAASGGGGGSGDRSYEVTLVAIREFEEALAGLDTDAKDRPERTRALMREAIESQLEDLRAQLADLAAGRAPPA